MVSQSITTTLVKSNLLKGALESKLGELLGALSERDELGIEYLADRLDRVTSSRDRQITVRPLDTITGPDSRHSIRAPQD